MIKYFGVSLLALLTVAKLGFADTVTITGAGATFPYPLYVKWAEAYQQQKGVNVNYQPIGSGGGIQQIKAKTINFGASDKPLPSAELQQSKLIQFPTVVGGIVAVVNLPGIKAIILSGPALAQIYLGKIKQWNDPQIGALNPGVALPNQLITVIHRSDGSGTSFLFTHYLSDVSAEWKTQVGSDTAVAWPAGIGGKGNEGVTAYVQRIKGSIGYVEYAYAQQNHLTYAQLQNQSGHVVSPSLNTFAAAASHAQWNSRNNFAEILTNEPGANSWPIAGATFILMNIQTDDPKKSAQVLNFFNWAYHEGKAMTTDLDYVPLPATVIQLIKTEWQNQLHFAYAQ